MTIIQQARPRPVDLGALLLQGEHRIAQLARAHAGWGLAAGAQWDLDQENGIIGWTFADRVATAPAQVIGTFNPSGNTWRWGWSDRSVRPALAQHSRYICEWAESNGHDHLVQPALQARDELAATVAALAVQVTAATGFFRGTGSAVIPFITFGPVTVTTHDGESRTFTL